MTSAAPLSGPLLLAAVSSAGAGGFTLEKVRTNEGTPTLRVTAAGRSAWLHSRLYPSKEAEKIVSGLDPSAEIAVVAGFGLGYHVEALKRRTPSAVIAVLEKERSLLRAALEARPELEPLLGDPSLVLFEDAESLIAWLQENANRPISWLIHRPSLDLFPDFYANFRTLISSFQQKRNINIATLSRFEKIWARNISRNISSVLADPGVSGCFDRFKGRPFVLVGAGPSLDANIPFLRRAAEECVLVAVDSSLPRLLREGIEPHFVFSVDPQLLNYYFFYLCRHRLTADLRTVLVYEPSCHFLIPRRWPGPRMTFDSIFPMIQWVAEICGAKGKLDMGGSVSTTAFDFAVRCGADTITLCGQDMAFDRDKTHGRGSLVEYVLLKQNDRTATFETRSHRLTASNVTVKVRSNEGTVVGSDRRLLLFYWWFGAKMKTLDPSTKVYTVSARGAAVDGIVYTDPGSATGLWKKTGPGTPDWRWPGISRDPETRSRLSVEAEKLSRSLAGLGDVTERAEKLSAKLYGMIRMKSRQDRRPVLEGLEKLDRTIESRKEENRLIGITMQKVLFSITEGSDDFLNEEEKADKDLAVARRSILLYSEMNRAVTYNRGLIDAIRRELGGSTPAPLPSR